MSKGILKLFLIPSLTEVVILCLINYFTNVYTYTSSDGSLMFYQIKSLHLYDCLRANKSTSAWGVEARVPFLDKEFINLAMNIDPQWKMVNYRNPEFYFHINFLFMNSRLV